MTSEPIASDAPALTNDPDTTPDPDPRRSDPAPVPPEPAEDHTQPGQDGEAAPRVDADEGDPDLTSYPG